MNNGRYFLFAMGMLLLCTGCTSLLTIEAKGTLKSEETIPAHVTYAVIPAKEVEKDPAFPTYARLVAKKMDERGFKETDVKSAKLGIYVAYGVTESTTVAPSGGVTPPMGNAGKMGSGGMGSGGGGYGSGGYGGGVPSQSSNPVKQVISQVAVVVGDLPKSRAAGSLVELWRGETLHRGLHQRSARFGPLVSGCEFSSFRRNDLLCRDT